jgi:Right handed beta helix region
MRLNSLILPLTLVGAMAMPLLYAAPAQAQATRTWVSGVGDDANPCSRTAPCKTWAGAISKTANGGEIDALDPGGFGAVNIGKSLTIDGGGGQVASTLVGGTNGFIIQAQPTDVVIIRNVRFDGLLGNGSNAANAGLSGIKFISGAKLIIDNCDIFGFNVDGVEVAGTGVVMINNTRIENIGNAGIGGAGPNAQIMVTNSRMYGTKFGVAVANTNKIVLSRSVSSNASTAGVEADPGGTLVLDDNVISFSTTGISGATQSFTNNRLFGNTSDGTAPTPIGSPTNPTGMK